MRFPRWLCLLPPLVTLAGCNFGDNLVASTSVDAGTRPDGRAPEPDASVDSSPDAGSGSGSGSGPTIACALLPQADCSGATPACDLDAADDGGTACRAVTKQGTANDHCAVATDCRAGYTCVHDGSDSADNSECSRFCGSDDDCPGTGSRCAIELTDAAGASLSIDVCSNACDPFAQTGCPSDMGCIGHVAVAGDFTDCAVMTGLADGATCTASVDCTPGSACVTDGTASTCEAYCIVGDDNTCDAGTCVGFTEPLQIGATEFGACQ